MKMYRMMTRISWIFLLLLVGMLIIQGYPEPMAKPMRPKVLSSPEELRKYLDLVKDYYSLNGKARYGKRSSGGMMTTSGNHYPTDTLRMVFDINQQEQRGRQMGKENLMLNNGDLVKAKSFLSTHLESNEPQIEEQMQNLPFPYNFMGEY